MGFVLLLALGLGIYLAVTQAWWWFFVPLGVLLLLTGLLWGLVSAFRPGWHGFVTEWEKREGTLRATNPTSRVAPMQLAYGQWRRTRRTSGESAGEWLERNGHPSRPEQGETKITSGWQFAIRPVDAQGQWSESGHRFAATRSFTYGVGGPYGSGFGYTHLETCQHAHDDEADSLPCLELFRLNSEPPSLDDIGSNE